MDAFALALSYGINKIKTKNIIMTAITVGVFHFFMPLIGNYVGISLFSYTMIKPKIVLFFIFLLLSIDMFIHFFSDKEDIRKLNIIGIIFFAFSVSFDSFSVGLGISYLYDNIILVVSTFCIISALFTIMGFKLGQMISEKTGKYSFLMGGTTLLLYSIWVLTK